MSSTRKPEPKKSEKKPEPKSEPKKSALASFFRAAKDESEDETTPAPDAETPKAVTIPKAKWASKLPPECAPLADYLGASPQTWFADVAQGEIEMRVSVTRARKSGDAKKIEAAKRALTSYQGALAYVHSHGGFDALERASKRM